MIQDIRKRIQARIKKMQEMFNKGLEEIKNSQSVKNNAITVLETL